MDVSDEYESQKPATRRRRHRMDEPDSEIRKLLKDRKRSSLQKYMWLTTGQTSLIRFAWYELLMFTLSGLPGALGIFLRGIFYRGLLQECGQGVVFGRHLTIRHANRIRIGDNVVFDDGVVLDGKGNVPTTITIGSDAIVGRNSSIVCKGGGIDIGRLANISLNCTLISESQLTIGEQTLVGGHCYIIAGGNHGTEFNGVAFVDQPRVQKGGVDIRSNCWLGAHATVLDGVAVGPDAIVGAGAVVHRDVAPRTVVGGVPAEVLHKSEPPSKSPAFRRVAH